MVVAFLCFDNSTLSIIAEAIMRDLSEDGEVYSFGVHPSHIRQHTRRVLQEVDLDTRGLRAKSMMEIPIEDVEVVISLVARNQRPPLPSHVEVIDWPLPDPIAAPDGEEREACRAARDELQRRISKLLAEWQQGMQ